MVHRREIDGQPIVLGNHGALWGNAMTWFDHGTGSVWSQPLGEAILGPLTGERLDLLPSTLTEWGDWLETYPESLALDAPSTRNGFDLDTMSVVVELASDSVAFPVPEVREAGVANGEVNGIPVAVVIPSEGDNWAVFSRQLDDRVVELELATSERGPVLAEIGGAGRWDAIRGLSVDESGTDAGAGGQNLDLLPGFTSFPGDYANFFPDGSFWQPDGLVPATSR